MDQRITQILFTLLRSAICGTKITEEERNNFSPNLLQTLLKLSANHDVIHLLVLGLKQNDLIPKENADIEKYIFHAVYRYEPIKFEYDNLCAALEKAQIPFLPLKGSVIRKYYPEPWMRTSCDIDILVHREDLETAISYLKDNLHCVEKDRTTHDVSLFTQTGIHVELHFDLVEEGRANDAIDVLRSVWDDAVLYGNSEYRYEMSDAFFYFYHIAHMAKHFEIGGCGIRPFIDLWILDHMEGVDLAARDELLSRGKLLKFANASRTLSEVWFGGEKPDELSLQTQEFLLKGGVYGSLDNRVALRQKKKGGRLGYLMSRIFVPYAKLVRYYPILEKHRWIMPLIQIRRWFTLLKPDVAKMAKQEIAIYGRLGKEKVDVMKKIKENIGL